MIQKKRQQISRAKCVAVIIPTMGIVLGLFYSLGLSKLSSRFWVTKSAAP